MSSLPKPYLTPKEYLELERRAETKRQYLNGEIVALAGASREHNRIVLNPTVLIEVLSPSAESYDRGEKSAQHRQLDSLQESLLASQRRVRIERFRRQGEFWTLTDFNDIAQTIQLDSIGCALSLREIYDRIGLPSPGEPGRPR